jgi:hypothetical protein
MAEPATDQANVISAQLVDPELLASTRTGTYLIDARDGLYFIGEVADGRITGWRVVDERGKEAPITVIPNADVEWDTSALRAAAEQLRGGREPLPQMETPDGGTPGAPDGGGGTPPHRVECHVDATGALVCTARY